VSFLFPQIEQTNLIALSLKCQVIFIIFSVFLKNLKKPVFLAKIRLLNAEKQLFQAPIPPVADKFN
jgi:hypothetical protein